MSLDLNVMNSGGQIVRSVGLGVDTHWQAIQLSEKLGLTLFGRLADYYSDAEFELSELPTLLSEVERLLESVDTESVVAEFLDRFADVIRYAMDTHHPLLAVAD